MINRLINGLKEKNIKSISKLISYVENNHPHSQQISDLVFPILKGAYRLGITGPPGAGKSTITNQLIKYFRKKNKRVAVILVDPTSPFSGGALLGDRIRMNMHYEDSDVFIRSVATRGSSGGLVSSANDIADILDAAGYDIIIFETVGVGQIEVDVVEQVDTVVLILVPESGDDIQMMKAGVVEVADIFLINKSDRKDADKLYASINNMLDISGYKEKQWIPKIIKTVGTKGLGVNELFEELLNHKRFIQNNNQIKKYNDRYIKKIDELLIKKTKNKFWTTKIRNIIDKELNKDISKRISPNQIFKKLYK